MLRPLLAALLLGYLLARIPGDKLLEALGQGMESWWPWWPAALLFTLLGLVAGALRWHGLLQAQGRGLARRRVMRCYFVGLFFNAFLPGTCGGDLSRGWMVARRVTSARAEAAFTVLVDRGVGLLVFMGCAVILTGLHWRRLGAEDTLAVLLIPAGLLAAALSALVFLRRRRLSHNRALAYLLEKSPRLAGLVGRCYEACRFYRSRPRLLARTLAWSAGNLVCMTLACHFFGVSLGLGVRLLDTFALFSSITVLSALPLTPGALGVREALFAHFYAPLGVPAQHAVTLSLLLYADGLLWSLCGGLLLLRTPRGEDRLPCR